MIRYGAMTWPACSRSAGVMVTFFLFGGLFPPLIPLILGRPLGIVMVSSG
jgi:hypothetical protein